MKTAWAVCAVLAMLVTATSSAEPVTLTDGQLRDLAAGAYEWPAAAGSTVVAAGDVRATIPAATRVNLEGSAQRDVRGLAVVNAAISRIAHGLNLQRVSAKAIAAGGQVAVAQANGLRQERAATGGVGSWVVEGVDRSDRHHEVLESAFSGGIVPQSFTFFGTASRTTTETSDGESTSNTETSDREETLEIGVGVAAAGEVALGTAGVTIVFGEQRRSELTSTTETTFSWSGRFFDFEVTSTSEVTVETESSIEGQTSTPTSTLRASGVVCHAVVGSCTANAGRHAVVSNTSTHTRAPARARDARAAAIALGGAELERGTAGRVRLAGDAQRGLATVNAANAVGSLLANGVNVAAGARGPSAAGLRQANKVAQRR